MRRPGIEERLKALESVRRHLEARQLVEKRQWRKDVEQTVATISRVFHVHPGGAGQCACQLGHGMARPLTKDTATRATDLVIVFRDLGENERTEVRPSTEPVPTQVPPMEAQ